MHYKFYLTLTSLLLGFYVFGQSPTTNPYCVDLDNSNDYVSIPHATSLNLTNKFTISFWVYPKSASANTPFLRKGQTLQLNVYNKTNYAIDLGASGQLRFFVYDLNGTARGILTGTPTLTANTWHHITGVYDSSLSSNNFKLYINGELVGTATWSGSIKTHPDPVILGYNHGHAANARIDELSIWNIALTQTQIQSRMYNALTNDDPQYTHLVGYWHFDEGTGTTSDDAADGLDATLANGTAWSNIVAPVAYTEHALYFDGVDDYVDFSAPASLNITSAITLEAWIKVRSFGDNEAIIDKLKDNSPQGGYNLSVMASKKVAFNLQLGSGLYQLQSTSTLDTGVWYLISATYDGTTAKIYISGSLDNSSAVSSSIVSNTDKIYIGYDDADTSRHFHGYIAEVRIWNTALTESEINNRLYTWINENDNKWNNLQAYWRFDIGKGNKAYDGGKNENTGTIYNGVAWVPVTISVDLVWQGYTMQFHNANNWLPKMVPNSVTNCIVPAKSIDPYVTVNSTCKNLTIQPDAAVVIDANVTLNVLGNLTINSGTSYTGYLVNYGTLQVQGVSYFKRYIAANGWHYVSSPINNGNSNTFLGGALYYYNEATSSWIKVASNTAMTNFKGYDVFYKNTSKTVTFEGTFNSGSYSASLTKITDGFNFIGNPYPATIDWDATQGWTKINVNNAIYIWDASINNYCEYVNGQNNNCIGRYIPPTMGFWVQCNSPGGGTISISPLTQVNTAIQFRNDSQKDFNQEYLKLKIFGTDYSDETSIVLDNNATAEFDGQYDARRIINSVPNMPDIYTISADNEEISINSLPFDQTLTLPLHVKIGITGKMTIKADLTGLFPDKNVLLEDLFLNKIHDFRTGDYLFDGKIEDDPGRFKIHILQNQSISNNTSGIQENAENPLIYVHSSSVYINFPNTSYSVSLFDLNGKTIKTRHHLSGFSVIDTQIPSGIYLVNVTSETTSFSKKIIIQ